MTLPEMVIVGDEAWSREEYEAEQERRARRNAFNRDYIKRPEVRAKKTAYMREWRERNPGYQDRYHARLVGSLHSLACIGPTRNTGCVCSKIRCYDKPR